MEERHDHPVPLPTDDALINSYLRPKIAGVPIPDGIVIHEVDAYSDYPYDLVRSYTPAHGSGDGDATSVWYFFSPVHYASDNRRWRKVGGADGKGVWHPEGRAKGSGGGTLQKLTYKEKTASAAIVKPGWLMTEYATASQQHGHAGQLVLCKIYRSPRGQGSDAPLRGTTAALSGHKRKPDAGLLPPPQQQRRRTCVDDNIMYAHHQNMCGVLPWDNAAPEHQTEQIIASGPGDVDVFTALRAFMEIDEDEMGVQLPANFDPAKYLLSGEQQQQQPDETVVPPCSAVPEECVQKTSAGDEDVLTRVREFMEIDEDKMGVKLHDNFDPAEYLLGEQQQPPSTVVPSCCAPPPEEQIQSTSEGDDVIEFTLEELMGTCSSPASPLYDPWMTPALCAF